MRRINDMQIFAYRAICQNVKFLTCSVFLCFNKRQYAISFTYFETVITKLFTFNLNIDCVANSITSQLPHLFLLFSYEFSMSFNWFTSHWFISFIYSMNAYLMFILSSTCFPVSLFYNILLHIHNRTQIGTPLCEVTKYDTQGVKKILVTHFTSITLAKVLMCYCVYFNVFCDFSLASELPFLLVFFLCSVCYPMQFFPMNLYFSNKY